MNIVEVAGLLGCSREIVISTIEEGLQTPGTKQRIRLVAVRLQQGYDVTSEDLDTFIAAFEADEPGRHPPVAVRRELLIESGYKCAVCSEDGPIEFHHIVEWSVLKHHDANQMLAVCSNCHAKIGRYATPDTIAQKAIKERLRSHKNPPPPAPMNPDEIRAIVKDVLKSETPAEAIVAPITAVAHPAALGASTPITAAKTITVSASPPPPQMPTSPREDVMRRIFSTEINFRGPSPEEIEWVGSQLLENPPARSGTVTSECIVLLRTMRSILQIQRVNFPDAAWTGWSYTTRLLECTQNVLAELDYPLDDLEKVTISLIGEKILARTD